VMKEAPIIPRRKIGFQTHVGKEFSGAFLIIVLLLLTFTLVLPSPRSIYPRAFDHAYAPVTIASGSMAVKPGETVADWFQALNWMRNNESVKIVASWWDYGYWITVIGNKTTLADNGTLNMTQIEHIAWMFLSNETHAIKLLTEQWRGDVTHIVIFITFQSENTQNPGADVGWGEESKWRWMARISERWTHLNDTGYRNMTLNEETQRYEDQGWNDIGRSTIIYKMMQYVKQAVNPSWGEQLSDASKIQFEQHFKRVYPPPDYSYTAYDGVYGIIGIFEVIY